MSNTQAEARKPLTVAVVDDQELERTGIELILDSADDITVIAEAATGEEAIPILIERQPDIVIMDIRMPGMGGIEATKIITERIPHTKTIVLTTFDLDEYAFGSLRAGASAFLLKSTRPEALIDAVRTVATGAAVVDPRLTAKLIDHYVTSQRADDNTPPDREHAIALADLTPRETDVLIEIGRGHTNEEISAKLHLAESTVKSHINSIFAKQHLRDRVHAVILARETWSNL
ncbi:response regulator [Microbacterium sp. GXS0129]|uniref:response regulator transcription factor n=1 Tax=Micrococcales TaxID=85006 RepID=UPI00383BA979